MRTTLKYFTILAGIAAATLVAESCAPDGPSTAPVRQDPHVAQQKLQNLRDKYGWIGKYHTDGLGYMYAQLSKGNGKPRSRAEVCKIAAKATKEFHKSARHGDIPEAFVDASLMNEACPVDGEEGKTSKTSKTILTGVGGISSPRSELSEEASNYINQIVAISGNSTSRYALESGVQSIESQATSLPGDEAGAVEVVASVALSSVDYWEANLDSWVSLPGARPIAYSLSPLDMTAATVGTIAAPALNPRYGKWWQNPYVKGFGKVLAADASAAARSMFMAWQIGPVVFDVAAASALWASGTTAVILIF